MFTMGNVLALLVLLGMLCIHSEGSKSFGILEAMVGHPSVAEPAPKPHVEDPEIVVEMVER